MFKSIYHRANVFATKARVRLSSTVMHGPPRISLASDEFMVVCLAKDAAYFIERFISHHLELGAKHVLIIDNGSEDETVELAAAFPSVTVIQNTASAKSHEVHLRNQIARMVAKGGWILFADTDELIDFPFARLTTYCNDNGYTSVIGHVLDMFSLEPFDRLDRLNYSDAIGALDRYSLSSVRSTPYYSEDAHLRYYASTNQCWDAGITLKSGGVRHEMFGETPMLSRHALVRNLAGIELMSHPHFASNTVVADTNLLIRHYKFAGDWRKRDRLSVARNTWGHGEDTIRTQSTLTRFDIPNSEQWRGIGKLFDAGFLYNSPVSEPISR